ncbi:MAG: hypothetical protein WCQ70_04315 [Lentimicrobiaceae bacterium]
MEVWATRKTTTDIELKQTIMLIRIAAFGAIWVSLLIRFSVAILA